MDSLNTLEQLGQLAAKQLGLAPEQIASGASFADMGLDSLMLVDFMFAVEDAYGIVIDHEKAMAQPTLAGLAALVDELRSQRKLAAA